MAEQVGLEMQAVSAAKKVMPVPVSSEPEEQAVLVAPAAKLRVEGMAASAALSVSMTWKLQQAPAVLLPGALELALAKLVLESEPEAAERVFSAPLKRAEAAGGSAFSFRCPRISQGPFSATQEFREEAEGVPAVFRQASEERASFPPLSPGVRSASVPWEARYP